MSIWMKTLLCFTVRQTWSRQILSLWTFRVLDLQQQHQFSSLSTLVSGLWLTGVNFCRQSGQRHHQSLSRGVGYWGVLQKTQTWMGQPVVLTAVNNVPWVQLNSLLDKLQGIRRHYQQLHTHGHVPTYFALPFLSLEANFTFPLYHGFYEQGPLLTDRGVWVISL